MKKLILLLFVPLFISGCKKCDCTIKVNRIILLKVDFETYQFEGAFEQVLSSPFGQFDTLPISHNFIPPGDFGNVTFYYQPNNELLFDGDIVWNGWGPINYPMGFDPPNQFNRLNNSVPLPDSVRFQNIFHEFPPYKLPLDSIWMDIDDLEIVEEFTKGHKKIGYFLYTPSVGIGNPADWDWIVVLNSEH